MASVPAAHRLFVASCLSSSSFSSLICRLCIFISVSLKAMDSKITQSQNQSAKLATTKHIIYTHLIMEKTHMQGAKESRNSIHGMKPSNAHSRVRKSLTKQNFFKKHHLEREASPHCTDCSQASLYGMRYP